MQTNPFKPTAGKTPPTIIGREDVLEEFNEGLINGPGAPGRLMRIAGVRGTGKTVLLDECARLAQSRGWTVIKEVATEGLCQRILEQLQPKFQAKHARFEPTVAGISIGSIDIERIGPSLRDAMRQTISKNGNGLLITLDEVQDAELDEVRTLSIAIQTSSTSMVADALNKTPQQVSSVRSRLLRESIIEAPSYGKVSFAIPYMRDYLYEHKAELEAEL